MSFTAQQVPHQHTQQCSSRVVVNHAVRVLLLERGKFLFSRNTNLANAEIKHRKAGELRESRDDAAHLGVGEVEPLKLSEVLKELLTILMGK